MTQQPSLFPSFEKPSKEVVFSDEKELLKKIDGAIKLLRSYASMANLALGYSGGKDSDVILRLAQLANIHPDVIHNSTTIDPPGTLSYVQKKGATIVRPRATFFQLVSKKGLPSMFRRFCCQELKERYIAPYLILGIRSDESVKRKIRYYEPTSCYRYSKGRTAERIFPILKWTNSDIVTFAEMENMTFHPTYYVNGHFDCTRRLGCVGCPLQADRGRSDYMEYPKFLRALAYHYSKYVANHHAYKSVYDDLLWQLFYSNHGEKRYQQTFNGIFKAPNPKRFLEDFFNIQLP